MQLQHSLVWPLSCYDLCTNKSNRQQHTLARPMTCLKLNHWWTFLTGKMVHLTLQLCFTLHSQSWEHKSSIRLELSRSWQSGLLDHLRWMRTLQLIAAASTLCKFYPTLTLSCERLHLHLLRFLISFFGGIHFWVSLEMGSQIESEAVWFWGVEQGVQYLKPGKLLAHPSCMGLDLLWFQVLKLTSLCYALWCIISLSPSLITLCVIEDIGLDKPTPAMTMIAYV